MLDDADVDGDTRSRWLATDGDRDVGEEGGGGRERRAGGLRRVRVSQVELINEFDLFF